MMKEELLNKTVIDLLRVKREIFKKKVKKETKKLSTSTPEKTVKKIIKLKEKERLALDSFQKKVETFYTNLKDLKIPLCEKLEARCINLDILAEKDILELHENAMSGRCDFFFKCKEKREECGCNLKPWSLSLSNPDKNLHEHISKIKSDGEE